MTYGKPPTAAEHARALRIRAVGHAFLYASLGLLALCLVTAGGTWFWYTSKGKMADLRQVARKGALMTPKDALGSAYDDYFDTPEKLAAEEKEAKSIRDKEEAVAKLREEVRRTDPRVLRIQALKERVEKWKMEKAGTQSADADVVEYRKANSGR